MFNWITIDSKHSSSLFGEKKIQLSQERVKRPKSFWVGGY